VSPKCDLLACSAAFHFSFTLVMVSPPPPTRILSPIIYFKKGVRLPGGGGARGAGKKDGRLWGQEGSAGEYLDILFVNRF
jgi:hypothetical protein